MSDDESKVLIFDWTDESKILEGLQHQNEKKQDIPLYIFKDGYTFIDILQNTHIAVDERPAYYRWMMENFNIGHVNFGETSGFHFVSPWADNSDPILKFLKTLSLQSTTTTGEHFPIDREYHWEGYVTAFKGRLPCGRDPRAGNIQAQDMTDAPRTAHSLECGTPESASEPWHDTAYETQGATVEDAT